MKDQFNPPQDSPDDELDVISKTRLKKESLALQELAIQLTRLNAEHLAQIPLDVELERAINETKNIHKREALRRHYQFLGKVMRSANHEAILAALNGIKEKQDRITRLLHVMEQWRDDLIGGEQETLEQFISTFPHTDRQQLRYLVRNAKVEKSRNKAPTNARKLFKFIREVMVAEQQDPE